MPIFDSERAETILTDYYAEGCAGELDALHEIARPLIEVIARSVDGNKFDDLTQEGHLKLQQLVIDEAYRPGRGTLYSFLSTALRNCMLDFSVGKTVLSLDEKAYEIVDCQKDEGVVRATTCEALLAFIGYRFSELQAAVAIDAARYVLATHWEDVIGKSRGVVGTLVHEYRMSRPQAAVFYHAVTALHRMNTFGVCWNISELESLELLPRYTWTYLPELVLLLGVDVALLLIAVFHGTYVKL